MYHSSLTFVFLSTLCMIVSSSPDIPLVHTTSGMLQGFSPYPNVNAYLGIPYALPPVGDLRFAPPQPVVSNHTSLLYATQNSAGCFQIAYEAPFQDKTAGAAESEDCLSINVWKPAQNRGLLPVLIWLYGGGFTEGANSLQEYNGIRFVAEQKNIILVSIKSVS